MRVPHLQGPAWGAALLVLCLVVAFLGGVALAGKPSKPPPAPPDGGTIYFTATASDGNVRLHGIAADGSGLVALAQGIPYYGTGDASHSEPSETPHACAVHGRDEHWFLDVRPIEPPPGESPETYPNGVYRNELFAVCARGAAVQLTNAKDVEPDHLVMNAGTQPSTWCSRPEWADGETFVSYLAKRWANGSVVEWGLYVLEVDPENLEDHVAASPTWIPVEMPLLHTETYPESGGHVNVKTAWSPDGASFVYQTSLVPGTGGPGPAIRADYDESTDTWSTTQLLEGCTVEDWSPVPDSILVKTAGYLSSMDPYDPTDIVPLLPKTTSTGKLSTTIWYAYWSPSGTHLAYQQREVTSKGRETHYIYVAGADGSDPTNITADLGASASILGWGGD